MGRWLLKMLIDLAISYILSHWRELVVEAVVGSVTPAERAKLLERLQPHADVVVSDGGSASDPVAPAVPTNGPVDPTGGEG